MYLCFAFPLPESSGARSPSRAFPPFPPFPRRLFEEAISHFQDPSTHRLSVHDDLSSGGFDQVPEMFPMLGTITATHRSP